MLFNVSAAEKCYMKGPSIKNKVNIRVWGIMLNFNWNTNIKFCPPQITAISSICKLNKYGNIQKILTVISGSLMWKLKTNHQKDTITIEDYLHSVLYFSEIILIIAPKPCKSEPQNTCMQHINNKSGINH